MPQTAGIIRHAIVKAGEIFDRKEAALLTGEQ
jgi:hypothetical protein